MAAQQASDKNKQANRHNNEKEAMAKKHKDEMDAATTPEQKAALKKKHDDEKAALSKKQNDEKNTLARKHKDEERQRRADEEAIAKKKKDDDDDGKDKGTGQGSPQLSIGSMPGMSGMSGMSGMFGNFGTDQFGNPLGPDGNPLGPDGNPLGPDGSYGPDGRYSVTPDGTGGPGTGPNGEDCVRISEDGICTLADGTQILPDGTTILPDGTRIPSGGPGGPGRMGMNTRSAFSKANIENAANLCRSVGINGKILGNGDFVMNCPIEIDNNEYNGPKVPYQYKIPFEVDARSRFLVTQFMTHSPSSGFRYYKVYGKDPREIEKSIQIFSRFQETINSPRGKFIGSLKDEISRLKSSLEKTQGELEDLEGEFENLEPTYKQNAADYIKLLQGKVASLSEQLAAAQRIRSKGMK